MQIGNKVQNSPFSNREDLETVTIGSVRTLLEKLDKLQDNSSDLQGNKLVHYYRGHASSNFAILPSIYRNQNFFQHESKLMREVMLRCPSDFASTKSAFESLVKMQHYGVPTRLLDVTENPLVALYFACSENIENENNKFDDGELILFSVPENEIKYYDSDVVSILSKLAWTPEDFSIPKAHIKSRSKFLLDNEWSTKLLHNIRLEKPSFTDSIDGNDLLDVACVKPKLSNPRIIKQSGSFLIFGIGENITETDLYTKFTPANIKAYWHNNNFNKRLLIPHDKKEKILKQLEHLGITAATLFPELDKVAEHLKRQFLGMERSKPEVIPYRRPIRGLGVG